VESWKRDGRTQNAPKRQSSEGCPREVRRGYLRHWVLLVENEDKHAKTYGSAIRRSVSLMIRLGSPAMFAAVVRCRVERERG
jgi:hypothetical protein